MSTSDAPTPKKKPSSLQHTLASQCGSAVSTILLYPIDVVRVRFMSQDGTQVRQHSGQTYQTVSRTFRTMYRDEGFRVFCNGCHVAVLGAVCAWGVYMYSYRQLCAAYASLKERKALSASEGAAAPAGGTPFYSEKLDTFLQRFGLSTLASCTSAVVCNPIWLLKTRMQIEDASKAGLSERHFRTFRGGIVYSVNTNGVRSLWRGTSAQVLLGIPNAATLPLYDTMKAYLKTATGKADLNMVEVCGCSAFTKVMVAFICHPIAVFKTRLQDHRAHFGEVQYTGFSQTVKTVWVRGGLKGMYRGFVPSLYQSVPRTIFMFIFYEEFLRVFRKVLPDA